MEAKYSYITRYSIKAICKGPLHVGGGSGEGNDILINPVDNVPFIQASSISGAIGAYIESTFGNDIKEKIFGSKLNGKSSIIFSDANFEKVLIERRPRLKVDGKTSTVASAYNKGTYNIKSGQKLELEYVSAGSIFNFNIHILHKDDEIANEITTPFNNYIEDAFVGINNHKVLFGGHKTNGCGIVHIEDIKKITLDMKNENDRKAWMDNNFKGKEQKLTINDKVCKCNKNNIQIVLDAKANNTILIKSLAILLDDDDSMAPDSMNITNGKNERVIPGSSLKGVIRSRAEAIARYKNIAQEYIDNIFGRSSKGEDNGISGTVIFKETVINDKKEMIIHRNKIDKFTGGTVSSKLFSEMPVAGNIKFIIEILDNNNIPTEAVCGIILLAVRDLAFNAISVGSGANIGRGFLNSSSITISGNNEELAKINIRNMNVEKGEEFILKCLNSVKKLQGGTMHDN